MNIAGYGSHKSAPTCDEVARMKSLSQFPLAVAAVLLAAATFIISIAAAARARRSVDEDGL